MATPLDNQTAIVADRLGSATIIWCLIMPLIHLLSLISNIICIIIFSSKTFIHKPIAIYFIGLLISDSTTLLIGYTEMIDRETHMIDKSFVLCRFNQKVIHNLTDWMYTFMERFCLEWMLYKVLWTRASTILLAILSIQRTRTFYSLSYRESRLCAVLACIVSLLLAFLITCLEWIGFRCEQSPDPGVYVEIFQNIQKRPLSKEFYSSFLSAHYNESAKSYSCLMRSFDLNQSMYLAGPMINQAQCTMNGIGKEFYLLTQSLLSHHRSHITDGITDVLTHAFHDHANRSNYSSVLVEQIYQAKSSDILIKLFEKRTCQMSFVYPLCVKIFDFLYSLSFGINRHTLAIFLGNALPSFIVFLANLLSLRAIFCSKSLKYLKQTTRKTRRKRRLQSDLRAFLVIAIQSFSVIMITWGIPIFLTMYHCRTLYVISIAACPQIKHTLAVFLFTDLFNSSTNCLLYSLSGKLFRRKFLATLKSIVTCGRGLLWHVRSSFSHSRRTNTLDSLPSTHANNCAVQSRAGSFRQAEFLSSVSTRKAPNPNLISRLSDEDRSVSNSRADDESILNQSLNSDRTNHRFPFQRLEESRSIKSYFLDKIRSIRSRPRNDSTQEKTKLNSTTPENQHRSKHASSPPSPRLTTPGSSASVRSINNYSATKSILPPSGTKVVLIENVTSL